MERLTYIATETSFLTHRVLDELAEVVVYCNSNFKKPINEDASKGFKSFYDRFPERFPKPNIWYLAKLVVGLAAFQCTIV